ncbi:MAG: hypothetical protein IJC26_07300 [Clostridia bacterium]|nr:hypothetical protein [Clostridia bacterium]
MDQPKQTFTKTEGTPSPISQQTAPSRDPLRPVGFWAFFGLIVLFSIPIVGVIAALIFLCASKNKNVKHFSGAAMTFILTRVVVSVVLLSVLLSLFLGWAIPFANKLLGTDFENVGEIVSIAGDTLRGNYSDALSAIIPGLTAVLGEEYEPFLNELGSGKYDELLRQLKNEQYPAILNDLENGKYPELTTTLDSESYKYVIEELKKEAGGGHSEFFDKLEEVFPD